MSITLHCGMVYRNAKDGFPLSLLLYLIWYVLNTYAASSLCVYLPDILCQCWKHSGGMGGKKEPRQPKQAFRDLHGRPMFGNTRATQSGRCTGEPEAQNGESSPGCRQTWRPWELLYFHLAARTCTQPRPEQTVGKTTEWKRHRNDPSRIVSTAAIADNCFPLTTLTVILHYSSNWVRSDIQQGEFLCKTWKLSEIIMKLFWRDGVWHFCLAVAEWDCLTAPFLSQRSVGVCCSLEDVRSAQASSQSSSVTTYSNTHSPASCSSSLLAYQSADR